METVVHPFCNESDPAWADMSNFVVHFTKNYDNNDAYYNMLGILGSGVIKARNPFGLGREKAPDLTSQHVVCFSEIPLHQLSRLSKKRSPYGIVFKKPFVIHRHGNPILYAYKDQPLTNAVKKLMALAADDPDHPIWTITPFVDAPGTYGNSTYFFEWEREWRKVGNFEFPTDEVEFLIIPEHLHFAAKVFFDDARKENLGPAYDCPFIDANWDMKKIEPLIASKLS